MLSAYKGYLALKNYSIPNYYFFEIKIKTIISNYVRPVLLCGCETRSATKGEVGKSMTSERKIVRHIYDLVLVNGDYRIRTNNEMYQMYLTLIMNACRRAKLLNFLVVQWCIKRINDRKMNIGKKSRR